MGNNNHNQKKRKPVSNKNADPMGNPQSMERYAVKVIKDIAYNNFDILKDGQIFLNQIFLQSAIRVFADMAKKAMIHRNAMAIAYYGNTDQDIFEVYQDDCKKVDGYSMIYNTLVKIQMSGDIGFLFGLQGNLGRYRLNL